MYLNKNVKVLNPAKLLLFAFIHLPFQFSKHIHLSFLKKSQNAAVLTVYLVSFDNLSYY